MAQKSYRLTDQDLVPSSDVGHEIQECLASWLANKPMSVQFSSEKYLEEWTAYAESMTLYSRNGLALVLDDNAKGLIQDLQERILESRISGVGNELVAA